MLPVRQSSLVSSYVGSHKSGTAQASVDIDAARLVLLDRAGDGDTDPSEDGGITF
ncbi:MAG: hypothetical protein IPK19_41850 [Chloroflexi bacterium]|nr:hypothetical protein [Chloroflexota bacterium]